MKFNIIMCFVMIFAITSSMTQAVIIDFEEFDNPGTGSQSIGQTYESNGFLFTVLYSSEGIGFSYYERDSSHFLGSVGLTVFDVGPNVRLTRKDNGPFDIHSIDLATDKIDYPLGVRFYTTTPENQNVSQQFTIPPLDEFTTYNFSSDFQGIYSLEWHHGAEYHIFDNVNVSYSIPEPCTILLLGIGALIMRK